MENSNTNKRQQIPSFRKPGDEINSHEEAFKK